MAKTDAERAKEYRDRKRDETVTVEKRDAAEIVTENVCRTCGGPVEHPKVVKCLKCCMT